MVLEKGETDRKICYTKSFQEKQLCIFHYMYVGPRTVIITSFLIFFFCFKGQIEAIQPELFYDPQANL